MNSTKAESEWQILPEGDANVYLIANKDDWFMHVKMNGGMNVAKQMEHLEAIISLLNKGDEHGSMK